MNEITLTRMIELILVGFNMLFIFVSLLTGNSLFILLLLLSLTIFYAWTILYNKKYIFLNAIAYIAEAIMVLYLMFSNSSLGILARNRMSFTNSVATCIVVLFALVTFARLQSRVK